MFKSFVISSCPFVRVIVPATEKLIVSLGAATSIARRNEPTPLSAVVVTAMVAASAVAGSQIVTAATQARVQLKIFLFMQIVAG